MVVAAGYHRRTAKPDGSVVMTEEWGMRGEEILLDPEEEARLDHAGTLAPAGATVEDIAREIQLRYEAFQTARRNMPETAGP
jgi:hypothetical protein